MYCTQWDLVVSMQETSAIFSIGHAEYDSMQPFVHDDKVIPFKTIIKQNDLILSLTPENRL